MTFIALFYEKLSLYSRGYEYKNHNTASVGKMGHDLHWLCIVP
jgi:hypothetical protein